MRLSKVPVTAPLSYPPALLRLPLHGRQTCTAGWELLPAPFPFISCLCPQSSHDPEPHLGVRPLENTSRHGPGSNVERPVSACPLRRGPLREDAQAGGGTGGGSGRSSVLGRGELGGVGVCVCGCSPEEGEAVGRAPVLPPATVRTLRESPRTAGGDTVTAPLLQCRVPGRAEGRDQGAGCSLEGDAGQAGVWPWRWKPWPGSGCL